MENKILALLGFAAKSGNLAYGMAATQESIKRNKSFLTICAFNISDKSKKELVFCSNRKGVPTCTLTQNGIEELSNAVGRQCGILSVNDRGFAEAILNISDKSKQGGTAHDDKI